jgi:PAS domain S-box-containing protein
MKKTEGSWQEEWEVSFNTLLARMMTRMTRILRLESTLSSSVMSMSNHNDNYSSKPSRGRAYSGSKESNGNSMDLCNLIDSVSNAPIFGVDHQGWVKVWNKFALSIAGNILEVVMGKNHVKEFITKDYQANVGMVIDSALHRDKTANSQFLLMTKEGAQIELFLNASAQRNCKGKVIGAVGIGQDITGLIAKEQENTHLIHTANTPLV